jgi:hypothetical protein
MGMALQCCYDERTWHQRAGTIFAKIRPDHELMRPAIKHAGNDEGGRPMGALLPALISPTFFPSGAAALPTAGIIDTVKDVDGNIGNKIFRRFTAKPKGTGLGLAITKRLVEQRGGSIRAQDAANQGAAFVIFFHAPASGEEPDL